MSILVEYGCSQGDNPVTSITTHDGKSLPTLDSDQWSPKFNDLVYKTAKERNWQNVIFVDQVRAFLCASRQSSLLAIYGKCHIVPLHVSRCNYGKLHHVDCLFIRFQMYQAAADATGTILDKIYCHLTYCVVKVGIVTCSSHRYVTSFNCAC